MAKFQPGQSGNPAGKPKGTRNRSTQALDELLPQEDRQAIVAALVERAKGGDVSAANVLLDRVWPKLRAAAPEVHLPLPEGSLADQAEAVVSAISLGEIGSDAGSELLQAFGVVARLREMTEMEDRLSALEDRMGVKK